MWTSRPNTNPIKMAFGCFRPHLPHEIFDPFIPSYHYSAPTHGLDTTLFWKHVLYTLIGTINHRCLAIMIDGKHKGILWFVSFFPARSNRRNLSGLNVEKTSQNTRSQSCFEASALWCKSRRYCIPVVCQRPLYY